MNSLLHIPEDKPYDCVGLGLNAYDRIITVPHYPPADGKVAFEELVEAAGGQVASALAALSSWGLESCYVGCIGDDHGGEVVRDSLTRYGVCLDHLNTVEGAATQQAFIVADQTEHSRTIFWNRDPQLTMAPERVDREVIAGGRLLLLDGHDEGAACQAVRYARDMSIPTILDIDQPRARSGELLGLVDCVFATRRFVEKFAGTSDHEAGLAHLHRLGPALVGVTLGAAGCLAFDGERFERVPSFEVASIDTTGAGDVFHAGLVYGLLHHWPMGDTLRFANAAGALATTYLGVQTQLPTLKQIQTLLQQ